MNWRKNIFSYILWVIYAATVSVGVLGITATICYKIGYPMEYGIAITIGFLFITGLLVLGVRKLWRKAGVALRMDDSMTIRVTEGFLVVFLLFLGICLRMNLILRTSGSVDGMVYYDAAVITMEKGVPQVVHGATYLYLQLLHLVLLLVGNKLAAAVMVQMVLQVLTATLLYVAVRKLSGALAGIIATAFLMLSPYMVVTVMELSPAYLFLLLYGIVLLGVAGVLQKSKGNPLWYVIVGVIAGVVCYLDIFGITLFLFLGAVFSVERDCHERCFNSRLMTFLLGILGGLAGFCGAIGIDAASCHKSFVSVLTAWAEIYRPGSFQLAVSTTAAGSYADAAILFGILSIGIFSFWCRKHYERQGIWIGVTAVLIFLQCFQMMIQNAGSLMYVYVFSAILAGIGLEAVFVVNKPVSIAEPEMGELYPEDGEDMEILDEGTNAGNEAVSVEASDEMPDEPPKVQLLENPLPLPKKHEPKVMDYRLSQVKEDSGYDYDVAEDDDFDI